MEVGLMRRIIVTTALVCLLGLAAFGAASPAAPIRSAATSGTRPPVWVQREALWQSLAAGEPHPAALQWRLTTPARAAGLAGKATSYLSVFGAGKVFVVVLRGHFRPPDAPGTRARRLYLVLEPQGHVYLAHGFTGADGLHLAPLGQLHSYVPQPAAGEGVWGHALMAGGPFPGGPRPLTRVQVVVWQGADAPVTDRPLTTVRSDWAGFFSLKLAPGPYTFRLGVPDGVGLPPTTVTVEVGKLVAAGVYEDVP
jgi:hypothetical protein